MRRRLSRWHRRIGLASLALLAWLALTGVLLNHASALGLDRPIGLPAIAGVYGIEAACEPQGWALGEQVLIDCADTVLLDTQALSDIQGPVRGALSWQDLHLVATEKGLLLLTAEGQRVEWLSADLLPGRPLRLGKTAERLVLQTPAGVFASDAQLLQWHSLAAATTPDWAKPVRLDEDALRQARRRAAVRQLSWTKLIQDLHSGRIIGLPGTLLADLGALSIIILALLGLVMSQAARRRLRAPAEAQAATQGGEPPNT